MSESVAAGAGVVEPLVVLEGVNKFFGKAHVLKDVHLSVFKGDVVTVIGPSGSGKSTLCRVINRLETIESGTIFFQGSPLPEEGRELARARADIGMVFQAFNLFANKTVCENVMLAPMKVRKLPKQEARELAEGLLETVGLSDHIHKHPSQLSGGQQQRAAIARALAMKPKLMLFDEPTSALDPEMIGEVLDVIRSLVNDGMTMMIVSHEMGFARAAANRIVFIDEGRILADSPPGEFFDNPEPERARDFLSKVLNH
ncbi:MAG: amino acid ABC transporter ATP-binding protein [Propionibacteriaceae bacterium]|nr:amino acid ABC transporter ATP-binding protein [Propionibacteriaceae bacterium]